MENRGAFVGFRVSATERRALDRLLLLERRRASEVLRDLIRKEAKERGVWPIDARDGRQAKEVQR